MMKKGLLWQSFFISNWRDVEDAVPYILFPETFSKPPGG